MTNYEYIKSMDIDKFAQWLDDIAMPDDNPWSQWLMEFYCGPCECVVEDDIEYAPCEKGVKQCEFANCEGTKIIKAWLEYDN